MTEETIFYSVAGPLRITVGPKGVRSVSFFKISGRTKRAPKSAHLKQCVRELREYFAGRRRNFSVRFVAPGTTFQKRVWNEVARVPYGQTRTYGQVAARLGKKKGSRAVGQAVGANPVCILVPCHRILGAHGLGGYAYGVSLKRNLLAREGTLLPNQ